MTAVEAITMWRTEVASPLCIEVSALSVRYGQRLVLRDVTLGIPRVGLTALVGPSGSGKSTFLACLNRMTDLSDGCVVTGEVKMEGCRVFSKACDVVTLRRRVGLVFQKPNPFPLSIFGNLSLVLQEHGMRDKRQIAHRVEEVLREVGLWTEVRDRLHAPAYGLSGGQQQRLCFARALMLDPEVLLLDEPCSALDPMSSGVVEALIESLAEMRTIVLVTHNLAQAKRLADHLGVFWVHDGVGTVVESGPAEALFEAAEDSNARAYLYGERG